MIDLKAIRFEEMPSITHPGATTIAAQLRIEARVDVENRLLRASRGIVQQELKMKISDYAYGQARRLLTEAIVELKAASASRPFYASYDAQGETLGPIRKLQDVLDLLSG